MRTRNSPHASRSSSSLSARRSRKAVTMPARSTSRRSSSSLSTSASSRSNGPSNASRSSSSSRTIMYRTLVRLPDAALGDGHLRPLGNGPRLGGGLLLLLPLAAEELPPDEERDRGDPDAERNPEVDPLAREVVGGVDPQDLLERAEGRVPRDVERKERRPAQPEAPVYPEQDADADQVPRELVKEGRVVVAVLPRRPVLREDPALVHLVDPELPREARRPAVQLLVPVVAPATDALREQEPGSNRIHHQTDAVTGAPHDDRAGRDARGDRSPDPESPVPHRREAPPVLMDRGILAPARDVVVRARADDAEDDAPEGDAEDEIPVATPAHPAAPGQPDAGR